MSLQPNIRINTEGKPVSNLNPFPVTAVAGVTQPPFTAAIDTLLSKLDTLGSTTVNALSAKLSTVATTAPILGDGTQSNPVTLDPSFTPGGGIPDAPFDGNQYTRRNGLWVPVVDTFGLGTLLTPAMTNNTTPAPFVASASSIYDPNYQPFRAFDQIMENRNDANDAWSSAKVFNSSGVGSAWLRIDLGQQRMLTDYILRARGFTTISITQVREGFPIDFEIRVSIDGTTYDVVDAQQNLAIPNAPFQPYHFILQYPVPARYIEINVTRVWTDRVSDECTIGQMQYYSSLNQ